MSETGTKKEGVYGGHEYKITREESDGRGYDYEFVLYIDGESITTATQIEKQGWGNPWIPALQRYAKAFIDGMIHR